MSVIRLVWGTGRGPTALASYDAALAEANVHNYNLVSVSSVIPAQATIEEVGEAPSLGPPGSQVFVVEARYTATSRDAKEIVAGLGWSRAADGPGIFYEATGRNPESVTKELTTGLSFGNELRNWETDHSDQRVERIATNDDGYTSVVVLAIYGEAQSIV